MSLSREMDKGDVLHIHNGILLSHKKEHNCATCRDVVPSICFLFKGPNCPGSPLTEVLLWFRLAEVVPAEHHTEYTDEEMETFRAGIEHRCVSLPAPPQRPLHVGWAPAATPTTWDTAPPPRAEGWNPGMERRTGWLLELSSHTGRTLVRRPPGPPTFFWYYSIFSLNFLYDLWLQSQILFSVIRRISASGGADFQSWNGPGTSSFSLCGLVEPGRALQGSLMLTDSRLTHALLHLLG